jgi:hypothetical protein
VLAGVPALAYVATIMPPKVKEGWRGQCKSTKMSTSIVTATEKWLQELCPNNGGLD